MPGNIADLAPGRMRYTMLTDETGGILDDLIVTNVGSYLFVVANAACRDADIAHIRENLPAGCTLDELDRGLVALQGPGAAAVLAALAPGAEALPFMSAAPFEIDGARLAIARSGYTGEDGFEISIPAEDTERIARMLLDLPGVEAAGLGARDTLRLEAGLCLYGQDIDRTTTPIEAGLGWTIGKRRRAEGGFPGAGVILDQLASGPPRRRVGIRPDGRAPGARAFADPRSGRRGDRRDHQRQLRAQRRRAGGDGLCRSGGGRDRPGGGGGGPRPPAPGAHRRAAVRSAPLLQGQGRVGPWPTLDTAKTTNGSASKARSR